MLQQHHVFPPKRNVKAEEHPSQGMGYTDGSGLGKNRDGIAAPIVPAPSRGRCGVCSAEEQQALAGTHLAAF